MKGLNIADFSEVVWNMKKYNMIIFVCTANTCRSPMAATIMSSRKGDADILVSSRGMVVLFPEPYNPKAVAVVSSQGLIMPSKSSRQLVKEDFNNDTLVLTMSDIHKQKIYATFENAINVYTLEEYVGSEGGDIEDPYGKGIEEYVKCYEKLYLLISKAADILFEDE